MRNQDRLLWSERLWDANSHVAPSLICLCPLWSCPRKRTHTHPYPSQKKKMTEWNEEVEATFVELWASHPCLYDTSCSSYSSRIAKRNAFEEITQATNMSGKWKKNLMSILVPVVLSSYYWLAPTWPGLSDILHFR